MYTSPKKWEKVVGNDICSENQGESHVPVLANEVLTWLACESDRNYVDCTVGSGGLAARILERTGPRGLLVGIDRDAEAIRRSQERLQGFGSRVRLLKGNFGDLKRHLASVGVVEVHGVIFDLGVSSPQLDSPARGFSFASDGPLDMRMDQSTGPTAADLLSELSETELADVIFRHGEERFARRIARGIVRARQHQPLTTTGELVAAIRGSVPPAYRHGRIHCATRTFQALRIVVNRELDGLDQVFRDAAEVLAPGGRLCIISFHSLEDRIAKRTLAELARGQQPRLRILTKKPQRASEAERRRNARARSAKLRAAERLNKGDRLCA